MANSTAIFTARTNKSSLAAFLQPWIGLQRVPEFVLALEAQRSIRESCG